MERFGAAVGRRKRLRSPARDRIAIEESEARFVDQTRREHPGVMTWPVSDRRS